MKNDEGAIKIDDISEEQHGTGMVASAYASEIETNVMSMPHQKHNKHGSRLVGKNVTTPYGLGLVLEYREGDGMYVIKLTRDVSSAAMAMLYTQHVPSPFQPRSEQIDELNVAYEALETMRRLNLEVMCSEAGIYQEVDYCMCTTCLLSQGSTEKSHFPRLQKLVDRADLQRFPRLHRRFFHSSSATFKSSDAAATDSRDMGEQMSGNQSTAMDADENGMTRASPGEDAHTSRTVSSEVPTLPSVASTCTDEAPMNVPTKDNELPDLGVSSEENLKRTPIPEASSPASSSTSQPVGANGSANFPRLRGLWGSIQSIHHPGISPAITPSASQNGTTHISVRNTGSPESSRGSSLEATTDVTASDKNAKTIRGLLNKSTPASSLLGSMASSVDNLRMMAQLQPSAQRPDPQPQSGLMDVGANEKPIALRRIQNLIDKRQNANTFPCLTCASPCCPSHSSSSFRREGITLCLSCEKLFEIEFIVDCVSAPDPAERSRHIHRMVDCYDRCILLLRYSSQFADDLAGSLEEQKEQHDKIGVASSTAGVLSGVLGIAAAASILTPAGPPLLIASLFLGGGATTAQTGSEALSYFSEPRKLADRIIALHSMAMSILRVTSTLRDALLRDHIRTDVYETERTPLSLKVKEKLERNKAGVLAGSNIGRALTLGGVAGAEVGAGAAVAAGAATEMGAAGAVAGAGAARSAAAFSRASTAAVRTLRLARFAGGALSAAVSVLEANSLQSTLKSIKEGSPCEKADTLRRVLQEIDDFPTSYELDEECQSYLAAMANRPPTTAEMIAIPVDLECNDLPEATCEIARASSNLPGDRVCAPGMIVVDGEQDLCATNTRETVADSQELSAHSSSGPNSFTFSGSTLLQRVQLRRNLAASSSLEEVVAVAVVDDGHLDLVV